MKFLSIISHPYALVTSFFFIIVSGQQVDQVYVRYLVAGLPGGAWHSLAGLSGIGLILYSHFRYRDRDKTLDEHFTNLVGVIMLVLSLFLFFYANAESYPAEAFNQGIFLTTMLIFCIFVTCFILIL